jgi:catechol 2,3-dioxygenase-like lactoylglutathione lyase family enzyme
MLGGRERRGSRKSQRLVGTRCQEHGDVSTRSPAQDLERARRFYAEKLGLDPTEEPPGGLRYECRRGAFSLFESTGAPRGNHTQMAWEVDDIDATVAELRSRGVIFEEYVLPGLTTVNGIAKVDGNYASAGGIGERAAWFRDSEGESPCNRPSDAPDPHLATRSLFSPARQ